MTVVAAAIVGGAVVGGVSTYMAGEAQAGAAEAGANVDLQISRENLDLQREMMEQQREDMAPWRDVGAQALDTMWSKYESGDFNAPQITQEQLRQDPGYQFRLNQGVEAMDASASARGRLLSGAQQKGLQQYGQEMGSQEYQNVYNRKVSAQNRDYNMLSGMSGSGQAAAAGQAGASGQMAANSGNILSQSGRNQVNALYQGGQAQAGAYQGYGQTANQGIQNWLMYKNLGGAA